MAGRPPKRAERRQGHYTRPEMGLIPAAAPSRPMPDPPAGLLKGSRQRWAAFWRSPVAPAMIEADLPALSRWIVNVDEWTRAMRTFKRERLVKGSTGQPALNPLAGYLAQREAAIREAEEKFGMTPMARVRLGIAFGQAKLTAQELVKSLHAEETPPDDDALTADWEEA